MSLFAELKRRNVFRVAIAYAVLAWLILQIVETFDSLIGLPPWTGKLILLLLALGFIPAVIFSWVYELTPEGLRRESEIDRSQSITGATGHKLNVAVIVMLVAVASLYLIDPRQSATPVESPAPVAVEPIVASSERSDAIAVLPFIDLSPQGDQGYFADGISEEILNLLAKQSELKVIARTSAFKFRGEDHDLREIGEALGANRILEGSVRTAGARVRITAQLIDSESNLHLWSETYDRELTDIFAVQDEIAGAISEALGVQLGLSSGDAHPIVADAYHLYLQGRKAYVERSSDRLGEAIDMLTRATEIDPGLDAAFGQLTLAHSLSPLYLSTPHEQAMAGVMASSDRALALNPNNMEAMLGRGYFLAIHALRIGEGEPLIVRALELRPGDVVANNLAGDFYRQIGDRDRALHYEARAVELDPLDAVQQWDLARVHLDDLNWEQALIRARRASALAPENRISAGMEAIALTFLGELDEAGRVLDDLVNRGYPGDRRILYRRHLIAAVRQDPAELAAIEREYQRQFDSDDGGPGTVARPGPLLMQVDKSWIENDLESAARSLEALQNQGVDLYWYTAQWTVGLVAQFEEEGIEFIPGESIREMLERRRGSPWEAIRLQEEIARARQRWLERSP